MSADGFVVLQLTPNERHVGSSIVFNDVEQANERIEALRRVAPFPHLAHFRVARIEYLEDAS